LFSCFPPHGKKLRLNKVRGEKGKDSEKKVQSGGGKTVEREKWESQLAGERRSSVCLDSPSLRQAPLRQVQTPSGHPVWTSLSPGAAGGCRA